MMKLSRGYYLDEDVVAIARDLIGKTLVTNFEEGITAGIITETEAYAGIHDRASHAWGGRRTKRTEVMFGEGGIAYVYLCYGIHSLFNIVTGLENIPNAVLIRGINAIRGIEIMRNRFAGNLPLNGRINGPGRVSRALAINTGHNGTNLTGNNIWLENNANPQIQLKVTSHCRIGIDYAGEDAFLPYRFLLNG